VHAVAKPLASMCATPDTSNPKNMFYIYVCEKVSGVNAAVTLML
jgi:hypothetical protein